MTEREWKAHWWGLILTLEALFTAVAEMLSSWGESPVNSYNSQNITNWDLSRAKKEGIPDDSSSKESACNARETGDMCSIPESGSFPGWGNDNPLQYSCWQIPWTEEPGGLHSVGLHRAGCDWTPSPQERGDVANAQTLQVVQRVRVSQKQTLPSQNWRPASSHLIPCLFNQYGLSQPS